MNKNHIFVSAAVALVVSLAVVWLVGGDNQSASSPRPFGGTTNYDTLSLSEDLTVTDDVTINGRSLTVTTSNTSTSTTALGCVQTTATSTATPIRFLIHSTTSPSTVGGQTASGFVAWGYGSCSI